MTLSAGTRLGPYEIVAPVGAGGMGQVYRARDDRLGRDVAVKTLSPHLFNDPEALARFEREARAVAALSHPNILAIFDFGREGEITYSVTELLEGETLRSSLLRGPLPPRKAIEVAAALADALAAAHARGLVHRDLKPENVFLTSDGVVKILDFGLARQTDRVRADQGAAGGAESSSPTVGKTTPGTLLGTFGYMSPEQARGDVADGRSDIFALGCVLYEMLTGDRAFGGANPAETLVAVLRDEPRLLARDDGGIPSELRPILARCLEKSRDDRFQSSRDLAFALRGSATPLPSRVSEPRTPGRIDSVAVIPFESAGGDPDFLYLSDGISESLTRALSRIESLRVISRSSVARYRGGCLDPVRAGRELGVHAVIAGHVAMRGEKLVIDAELVDVLDGRQIWGQRYERAVAETYALEEELASDVADRLRPRPVAAAPAGGAFPSAGPKSAAYQLYLKGRYHWNRRPEESSLEAPSYFEKAIEADPSFALAYSGLADCYITFGSWESGLLPPNEAFLKARTLARKALQIDDRSAEAHASLGYALFHYDWDFQGAERELQRAIELDPGYSAARHWYSHFLLPLGRVRESERESLAALEVDPHDFIMNAHLAWHHFFARNYDEAVEHADRLRSIVSNHFWSPFFGGLALEQKGSLPAAIERFHDAAARAPSSSYAKAALAHACGIAGDSREARRLLEELSDGARRRYLPAYDFAIVHLGLGNRDEALDFLEQGVDERSSWSLHFNVDPRLDPLRGEERFRDLVARIGLPANEPAGGR